MDDGSDIAEFLAAEKVALRRWRWSSKNHPDYVKAESTLSAPGTGLPYGRLIASAHVRREPMKYGFNLVFRNASVFRLDVEPGRSHRKSTILRPVNGTHWQIWPHMDRVEPDARNLGWTGWLDSFLLRVRIRLAYPLPMPPFATREQLELEL